MGIFKFCIGEPVAEGIAHLLFRRRIIAVADEYALFIHLVRRLGEAFGAGNVGIGQRPRLRQPARGLCPAEQEVGARRPAALAGQHHVQKGVHLFRKGKFDGRAAEEDDGDLFARPAKRLDEGELVCGQPHALAVGALAFDVVRQPREHERLLEGRGERQRFVDICLLCGRLVFGIAAGEGVFDAHIVERLFGRCQLYGVDHRAARALVAHLFKQVAADEQFFPFRKGQDAVVFQQHGAVCRHFAGKAVVCSKIAVIFLLLCVFFRQMQHVCGGFIQIFHGEGAVFDAVQDLPAADGGVARHL